VDEFRQIALSLEGAEEGSHRGQPDFWVGGHTATAAPLTLEVLNWSEEQGGPAGTALVGRGHLEVGSDQETTVNKLWTIPEYDYVIGLRFTGKPPSGPFSLRHCLDGGCAVGCGPLPEAGPPDASGSFRFQAQDLGQEQSVSVVSGDGTERKLTDGEMRELLTTHRVDVAWP